MTITLPSLAQVLILRLCLRSSSCRRPSHCRRHPQFQVRLTDVLAQHCDWRHSETLFMMAAVRQDILRRQYFGDEQTNAWQAEKSRGNTHGPFQCACIHSSAAPQCHGCPLPPPPVLLPPPTLSASAPNPRCSHAVPAAMAPRDGEDSDVESEEACEWLLGFVEAPRRRADLLRHRFPSKVGGRPAWLDPLHLPTQEQLTCRVSGKPLDFLLQVGAG